MTDSNKRASICLQVAAILKSERERRGVSMTVLATRAGLSQQMISYVERGIRNPTLDTLLRITTALEIELASVIASATRDDSGTICPSKDK